MRKTFSKLACIVLTTGILALPWVSRAYAEETAKLNEGKWKLNSFVSETVSTRYFNMTGFNGD